jgi:hypothetical protein
MAKSRNEKTKNSKPPVKVADLEPRNNPTGGKATTQDIVIVKLVDKPSTKL